MKNILISLFILGFLLGEKLPNDIRWVVKSKEYIAICNQTYQKASVQLDNIIKRKKNIKNLAIVMDLDETVLDNSQYQVEITNKGESFNMKSWSNWVLRSEAKLVPGVFEFIKKVRKFQNLCGY